jgi:hypothetical protein
MNLNKIKIFLSLGLLFTCSTVIAQDRKEPRIALTLGEVHDELLVTVNNGRTQRALLTVLKDSKPTHLLVAHSNDGLIGLVGYPQLTGSNRNAPLIRARHLFVSENIALVQFECPRDTQNARVRACISTSSPPTRHHHPHGITTHTASPPTRHHHPHGITTHTASPPT